MDNLSKILGGALILALLYIIFLSGCGRDSINGTGGEVISIDTVRHETVYDTTWYDTTRFKYITVETPKIRYRTIYDTIIVDLFEEDLFDEMMRHPAVYEDSIIKDDTVHLTYRATVRGYLDKIELGYKIVQPLLIAKTTTIETEITKIKRPISFYIGLDAAANADGPTHFAPMAELVTPKMTYNAGFDILNKAVVIGARARISFRKKPKIIPIP